jgi:MFS family permease
LPDVGEDRRIRHTTKPFDWWLTGICVSRAFNGLVFMTYAAVLPVLQREWAMTGAQAGLVSSGFQMGYAVSLVVFSSLADRLGPKPLFLGSMSAAAFFALGFAFLARDYPSALVIYTLVAISLGGTYTTGLMLLAQQYSPQKRGRAIGYFIASTSLGYALSLVLSGAALPIGGYRLSFLITCSGPAAGALLVWITLRNTPTAIERRSVTKGFARTVLTDRPALLIIGGYIFHSWELLAMWAWTPAFLTACLVTTGTDRMQAAGMGAYITASFHVLGMLASLSMGALSDRMGRARVILALAAVSTACSFGFGWSIAWPLSATVAIGLVYAFTALGDSPVLSAALTEVVPAAFMGAAFGLRSLLGFAAGALSPLLFGVVLDWSNPAGIAPGGYAHWGWAFAVLGLGGLGAVWCAHRFGRLQGQPAAQKGSLEG